MGRAVVGDENQLGGQVDAIFRSGCSVQVGLLVGKWGSGGSRDLVFALVPTPTKDGEEAATVMASDSKGPSPGSSRRAAKGKPVPDSAPMVVSTDWICEHARQVSRMLLGGMHVIGVYAFATEGTFKSSLATLWQAVMAVAASAPPSLDKGQASEYLLLQISASPRRLYCRSCSKGPNFSTTALRPCEWKLGKLLNNLQEFSCTYNVDIRYPVHVDGSVRGNKGLRVDLSSAIASEAERLQAAYAVVDGSLVQPEKLLGSGSTVHTVELLLPFDGGARVQSTGTGAKAVGKVVYNGEIHARAYAVVREPVARAVADLKGDIVGSLRSRLELLLDEAELAADDAKLQDTNDKNSVQELRPDAFLIQHISGDVSEHSILMPRRVFVPWLEGAMISDYMLPDESFEDVEERFVDLFGVKQKLEPSAIIEPEMLGTVPATVVNPPEVKIKEADGNSVGSLEVVEATKLVASSSTVPFPFFGAALVLLIALLLSLISLSR